MEIIRKRQLLSELVSGSQLIGKWRWNENKITERNEIIKNHRCGHRP